MYLLLAIITFLESCFVISLIIEDIKQFIKKQKYKRSVIEQEKLEYTYYQSVKDDSNYILF